MQRRPTIAWVVIEKPVASTIPPQRVWWRRLWSGFVEWLFNPIPFPGELPVNEPPSERYNEEANPTSELNQHVHKRETAQSR